MTETPNPTPPAAPVPPKAIVDDTRLDYSTATESDVKSHFAGLDLGGLLKDPKNIFFLIDLINKIKGMISRPKPIDPPVTQGPNGPVVIPPPPPPPVEPPTVERIITSLRAKFYHISRKNRDISQAEFNEIINRTSPLQRGDRVHLDCTPYDQFGLEVEPGSPELEQLVRRWTDPETGEPKQELRLRWLQPFDGVGEITNEYDDYGMTPVYKVPRNLEIGQQYELGSFTLEFTPEGSNRPILSNELPSLRVRPWQE